MANETDKLLKADKEGKLIVGFNETLKAVKLGNAKEVFMTKSCSEAMKRQMKEAADLSKISVLELPITPEALSAQLKKPFNIAVAAISSK
ncbi:MAG: ribosomal L7Ae/L30e/S12e/Gadd45 family protein [DPANN group archaeon]|nr:ribosomal L7Ae/L30e/S12e/Gadd45 family protein [DPANN group archaeon]